MNLKDLIADVNVNVIYEHIETETLSEWVNAWQKAALSALRPVSREQVERVWPGCKMCKTPSIAPPVGIYCPWCGAPRTAEAKTNLRKRLEALNDGKGD